MSTKEYCVVFDSNTLYEVQDRVPIIFNSNLNELKEFISKAKIENVVIKIPEMVIKERIKQCLDEIKNKVERIDKDLRFLQTLGVKSAEEEYKKVDYNKILNIKIDKFIKDNLIEVINIPKIEQDEVINRVINKICPFKDKDKGFKDTIIWLSIINDAKQNPNVNYIFCSNNTSDFNEDLLISEFKLISKKEFKICKNMIDLKEYLNQKLVLRLELKKLYDLVEKKVKEHIGEIMIKLHSEGICYQHIFGRIPIPAFELINVEFLDIISQDNSKYIVTIKLLVNPIINKKDLEKLSSPYHATSPYHFAYSQYELPPLLSDYGEYTYTENKFDIKIKLNYNKDNDSIKVEKIETYYPLIKPSKYPEWQFF
jgi:hypothetical protein